MLRDNRAGALAPLVVGAIGVVFGDIGTPPLIHFAPSSPTMAVTLPRLRCWCYLNDHLVPDHHCHLHLRWPYPQGENQGEGGILALAALITRKTKKVGRLAFVVTTIAIVGASLSPG